MPKRLAASTIAILCGLLLSNCKMIRQETDTEAQRLLGPERLDGAYMPDLTIDKAISQSGPTQQAWLGAAVLDSLQKCQAFTARLGVVHGGDDLALDVTTLGLTGAAAVTVPAHVASTLAVLAGISAGTRAAIDADLYQQNTAPVIV
jgi:hypothetical protein